MSSTRPSTAAQADADEDPDPRSLETDEDPHRDEDPGHDREAADARDGALVNAGPVSSFVQASDPRGDRGNQWSQDEDDPAGDEKSP